MSRLSPRQRPGDPIDCQDNGPNHSGFREWRKRAAAGQPCHGTPEPSQPGDLAANQRICIDVRQASGSPNRCSRTQLPPLQDALATKTSRPGRIVRHAVALAGGNPLSSCDDRKKRRPLDRGRLNLTSQTDCQRHFASTYFPSFTVRRCASVVETVAIFFGEVIHALAGGNFALGQKRLADRLAEFRRAGLGRLQRHRDDAFSTRNAS